jgi:hypothetical protein
VAGAATRPEALRSDVREHTMPVAPWLEQSQTPQHDPERASSCSKPRPTACNPTGLRAARDPDGQLTITQRWALIGT